MNRDELGEASNTLGLKKKRSSKIWLWIIIGIIVGIVALVILFILCVIVYRVFIYSSYPFIPTPRNIVRSRSFPELLANLIMDASDTQVEYAVVSRKMLNG